VSVVIETSPTTFSCTSGMCVGACAIVHEPLVAGGLALRLERVGERGDRLEVQRLLLGEHVRADDAEHLLVHVGQERADVAPQPLLARLVLAPARSTNA
jgi:hypothetical protein